MNNLEEYKKKFLTLVESKSGEIKPLISDFSKFKGHYVGFIFLNTKLSEMYSGEEISKLSEKFGDIKKIFNDFRVNGKIEKIEEKEEENNKVFKIFISDATVLKNKKEENNFSFKYSDKNFITFDCNDRYFKIKLHNNNKEEIILPFIDTSLVWLLLKFCKI